MAPRKPDGGDTRSRGLSRLVEGVGALAGVVVRDTVGVAAVWRPAIPRWLLHRNAVERDAGKAWAPSKVGTVALLRLADQIPARGRGGAPMPCPPIHPAIPRARSLRWAGTTWASGCRDRK